MTYFEQVGTERIKDDAITDDKIDSGTVPSLGGNQTFTGTNVFDNGVEVKDSSLKVTATGGTEALIELTAGGALLLSDSSATPVPSLSYDAIIAGVKFNCPVGFDSPTYSRNVGYHSPSSTLYWQDQTDANHTMILSDQSSGTGPTYSLNASGKSFWGVEGGGSDVEMGRSSMGTLRFGGDVYQFLNRNGVAGGTLFVRSFQASDSSILSNIDGESGTRYRRRADGEMNWGDGTVATDTNLYRSGVGELTTDTALVVGTDLNVNGNVALGDAITDLIGLYGAAAVAQAAAIASPAVQTAAYVQADVQSIADAVDDIRTALTAIGITA